MVVPTGFFCTSASTAACQEVIENHRLILVFAVSSVQNMLVENAFV